MSSEAYLAIGLAAALVPGLVFLLLWWRKPGSSQALGELERRISESFSKASIEMAARVEQLKGDLRVDLADRLQQGLNIVRETVDRQLTEGRAEQSRSLAGTTAGLEQKFELLRNALTQSLNALEVAVQVKFDKLKDAHGIAAREARDELGKSLAASTTELQKRFQTFEDKTAQNLENIRVKVDERLEGISAQVQQKLEKNIQEGFAHFVKVQEHLKAAEEQLRHVGAVGQSINELNSLLKLPHLRGKFGEVELGRLLADFLPAEAYEEQVPVVPDSKEAVDAVVKFPQARLPIDSKFNREQVLPLFETSDPHVLKDARKQLAGVVKQEAQSINEKYIHPEHGTTDLALMFLPSETLYFEVIRNLELCEALHKLKVFPVSPNTLAITLKSVALSFGFYEFSKNIEKTLEQVKQAQRSFSFFEKKFKEVGKGLEKAQQAYGTAAGHLSRYSNDVVRLTGEPAPELSEPSANSENA